MDETSLIIRYSWPHETSAVSNLAAVQLQNHAKCFFASLARGSVGVYEAQRVFLTLKCISLCADIEEKGVRMKLTVIDTPGFGDQINNENWYATILLSLHWIYKQLNIKIVSNQKPLPFSLLFLFSISLSSSSSHALGAPLTIGSFYPSNPFFSSCVYPSLPFPLLPHRSLNPSLPWTSWRPIMKFINDQYEAYLQEEININRKKRIPDSRVHCCIYFIPPTGHWWGHMQTWLNIDMRTQVYSSWTHAVKKACILILPSLSNKTLECYQCCHQLPFKWETTQRWTL